MATVAYPKIPESNWWKLRDQFRKTLPSAVTTAYLRSLLGLNTEGAAQNLVGPLRQVGLIDDSQKPTPRANDWRNDAKYPEVCHAIVAEVYPQELRDLYSGPGLDRQAVETWFMHNAALGQAAARRNAQLYVLLNDGSLRSSEKKADSKRRVATPGVSTRSRVRAAADATSVTASPPIVDRATGGRPSETSGPTVHLDLQIHISPEATPEQIDAILAAMAKHFNWK